MIKCTSFFGHKYEPRYNISSGSPEWINSVGKFKCSEHLVEQITEMTKAKSYVYDICIRCGETVRQP